MKAEKISIWVNDHDGYAEFPYPLLGTPPVSPGDRVLGVFESVPLAMIDHAMKGSGLEAYARLRSLGSSEDGSDVYGSLNGELDQWIRSGKRGPEAPTPDSNLSGVSGEGVGTERQEKCLASIENWIREYAMKESLNPSDLLNGSRHLEMSQPILVALSELKEMISKTQVGSGEVW
jgi:hypothetical protein